jgi:hypothetical protein
MAMEKKVRHLGEDVGLDVEDDRNERPGLRP